MTQNLEQRVIELAAEQAGVDTTKVTLKHHFVDDLNYDSLDKVEFAMQLEEEFELRVADDELDTVQTVGDAAELVKRALTAASAA
jgi:acyl carrier protein